MWTRATCQEISLLLDGAMRPNLRQTSTPFHMKNASHQCLFSIAYAYVCVSLCVFFGIWFALEQLFEIRLVQFSERKVDFECDVMIA